jgi:hydrogenase expression/formation protein HypC
MCLGVPGQIVERTETRAGELASALVAFGGLTRSVCIALVPEVGPGDYVLVHAGLALEKIDEDHASELLAHLRAMNDGEMAELSGDAIAETHS